MRSKSKSPQESTNPWAPERQTRPMHAIHRGDTEMPKAAVILDMIAIRCRKS